ncbi:acyltransferase domain-containing protein, partial [Candidatus Bandiella numerosa]|uniref:acyltransferase domain-containing protein n=1 Tax=Candidatus Bandiella numerosa TaxID=2570586 RepID=UPI001F1A8974
MSGKEEILNSIVADLTEKGIPFKELKTSHAFHSFLMDPILNEFAKEFDEITFNEPEIKIISNLTGATVSDEMCKPEYWTNQLRKAVKFDSCASAVLDTEAAIFVEVGPGNTLVSLIRSNEKFDASKHRMIHTVRRPNEKVNDSVKFLTSLA